jgi:hypothetical protein
LARKVLRVCRGLTGDEVLMEKPCKEGSEDLNVN